jgi:hypothetical protein
MVFKIKGTLLRYISQMNSKIGLQRRTKHV